MSLTILEGPDGAGKTTLAEYLMHQHTEGAIDHHGPYDGETNTARFYASSVARGWYGSMIMDRAWHAEPIYGGVYRKGSDRIGSTYRRMLDRLAWSAQAVFVLCLPPKETCLRNWEARRGEEYLSEPTHLNAVYDGYAEMSTELPTVRFDYTRTEFDLVAKTIELRRPMRNRGPGVGHWNPGKSILMVGDKPARETSGYGLPFVAFRRDGCSAWLADRLEEWEIPESRLYWVNARSAVDVPLPNDFVRELSPKAVVALGRQAERWVRRCGVTDYHVVDHPQYWKRFHHHRVYPLANVLKEINER
jgi:thymidylate kinase